MDSVSKEAVTQADLDAAADLIEAYWKYSDDETAMLRLAASTRAGQLGTFPAAFAAHRARFQEATRLVVVEECAAIAEARAPAIQCMSAEPVVEACFDIAAEIRSLQPKGAK